VSDDEWDDETKPDALSEVSESEVRAAVGVVQDITAGLRFAAQVAVTKNMSRAQYIEMAVEQFEDCEATFRKSQN
jgi:hypothetical protein